MTRETIYARHAIRAMHQYAIKDFINSNYKTYESLFI